MNRGFSISAPSRLHFGLLDAGGGRPRCYGGAGVMIATPRTVVQFRPAADWAFVGPGVDRVQTVVERMLAAGDSPGPFEIEVVERPPSHSGFGSGTQLALCTAWGLLNAAGEPSRNAAALAKAAGRGRRSAIGVHGFLQGGLLWELGKPPGPSLSPLEGRVALPSPWRVVCCRPGDSPGRCGQSEEDAMGAVSHDPRRRERLEGLLLEHLAPAAERGDLADFGAAVRELGRDSGAMYRDVQSGVFSTPASAAVAEAMEQVGLCGVGQSSWGPVLFGFAASAEHAADCRRRLREFPQARGVEIDVAELDARGAIREALTT